MKLSVDQFKSMTSKQLYDLLKPTIKKLKIKYDYAQISEATFDKWSSDAICYGNSKSTNDQIIDLEQFLEKNIKNYIRESFSNRNSGLELFNRFLANNIKFSSNYDENIMQFDKISSFFTEINYLPNQEFYLEIIKKNIKIEKILKIIVRKNIDIIEQGNIDSIFDDNILISFVESYCLINKIDIEEKSETIDVDTDDDSNLDNYTNDLVRTYLREIKKPLLTKEEEYRLMLQIREGNQQAREIFIERNLRLVVSIARKYVNRGVAFLDLIREGNIGLMTAVDKFDVSKGYQFSTYATWWIRQAVTRSIAFKGRNIRLPVHVYYKIKNYKRVEAQLKEKLCREPTLEEIAKALKLPLEDITQLHEFQHDTVSVNQYIGDDDTELEEFISDSNVSPENESIANDLPKQVDNLLKKCNLKPNEMNILKLRYGIGNEESLTLEQIGKKYGLTRERIRQIEAKAFMKIRRSKYIKDFADYTENPEKSLENIEMFRLKYWEDGYKNKAYLSNQKSSKSNIIKNGKKQKKESDEKMNEEIVKNNGEKNKRVRKDMSNLYHYFSEYSEQEVTAMLEKLPQGDLEILHKKYGEDLLHPVNNTNISSEEKKIFYARIVPKMKRILGSKSVRERKNHLKKIESFETEVPVINEEGLGNEATISQKHEDIAKEVESISTTPFVVYIAGVDTWGDIDSVSRSDVNMVAAINPSTHQVLLVTIPRDYYVQLHGTYGVKDKLTHAGIYGINKSVTTIEDLLHTDINYYMKGAFKIYTLQDFEKFIRDTAKNIDTLKNERAEINKLVNYSDDGKNAERVTDFIIKEAGL